MNFDDIFDGMAQTAFGVSGGPQPSSLTLADIKRTIEELTVTYYDTSEFVEPGKVYIVPKAILPKFILCHPEDLPRLKETFPGELVNIKDRYQKDGTKK